LRELKNCIWWGLYEFFKFNLCNYNILKIKNILIISINLSLSKQIFFQKIWKNSQFSSYFCPSKYSQTKPKEKLDFFLAEHINVPDNLDNSFNSLSSLILLLQSIQMMNRNDKVWNYNIFLPLVDNSYNPKLLPRQVSQHVTHRNLLGTFSILSSWWFVRRNVDDVLFDVVDDILGYNLKLAF